MPGDIEAVPVAAAPWEPADRGAVMSESRAEIEHAIFRLLAEAGSDRTVNPTDVAREIAPDAHWHLQMPAIRRVAVELASSGRIVIYRKGKPVDPREFKGVYRLGLPRQD